MQMFLKVYIKTKQIKEEYIIFGQQIFSQTVIGVFHHQNIQKLLKKRRKIKKLKKIKGLTKLLIFLEGGSI